MFSTRSLKHIVSVGALGLFSSVCAGLLILYVSGVSLADSPLYLSEALPLILGVMGVLIAVREDWAKQHPWRVIGAFVVVSLIAFSVNVHNRVKSERELKQSQEQIDAEISDLRMMRGELRDVKTQIQQPNPDKASIVAKLDKLIDKANPLPTPAPVRRDYKKLTNRQLRNTVEEFINTKLRPYADRSSQAAIDGLNDSRQLNAKLASAKTDQDRKWANAEYLDKSVARSLRLRSEYDNDIRPDAIFLRDEMLRRISQPKRLQTNSMMYEELGGSSPLADMIADMEMLAMQLD